MKRTALITGASSGIGYELANVHARNGDNLVIIARNIKKINELKVHLEQTFNIAVLTIQKDLTNTNAAQEIFDEVKRNNIEIDYLINNAGIGDHGFFHEAEYNKIENMISLNVNALTMLTKLFLPDMIKRGNGRIMNVASTAAFQPGPLMAVYYASKAFVLNFSLAISNEVKGKGITVTTLCPGPTESGFWDAAYLDPGSFLKIRKLPSSREVAEYGYKAMMKGKRVAIHGKMNKLVANAVRIAPSSLILMIARFIQDSKRSLSKT